MPSITSALSFAAVLAPVLGLPTSPKTIFDRQDAHCPTNPAPDDFCSTNPADRWIIQVTDERVPWGALNPGDVTDYMRSVCSTGASCQHDNSLETTYVDNRELKKGTLKITENDVSLDRRYTPGMIDMMQFTLDRVLHIEEKTYLVANQCAVGQCQPSERKSVQMMGPKEIRMTLKTETEGPLFDRGTTTELKLEFGFEAAEATSLNGACGALGGAVAGIVGALNPALGVVSSVALIACLGVP